jgi:hypothetical protein
MANTIKLKSSVVAGKIPTTSDISKGEVAVNYADAKIFGRHPSTDAIIELGGAAGSLSIDTTAADLFSASSGTLTADDPGADRLFFWDDSAGRATHLEVGTGLAISGTTLSNTGGLSGTGSVDNAILRADGTGGSTLQTSGLIVDDAVVPYAVTGDAATDVITATGHIYTANQTVIFSAITGGAGLTANTVYFVRNPSGNTFQLSTTSGGAAINFTTNITAGTVIAIQANVTLSENTTETNSALVLTPKGTGALIAGPKPDGTATGGNARGTNAICLVTKRSAANQVAAGQDSIAIGTNARASNQNSIAIGTNAQAIGVSIYGSIAIGESAVSSSDVTTAVGYTANASGTRSTSIGGQGNSASGQFSTQVGGWFSQASGTRAFSGGASDSNASGTNSIVLGERTLSNRSGMFGHANGMFSANGDAQRARFVLRNKTTNATATELFLDGSSTRLTIPSGKTIGGTIQLAGASSGGEEAVHYIRQFLIRNRGGTTGLIGSIQTVGTDIESSGLAACSVTLTADDTNDSLKVEVQGPAALTGCTIAAADEKITKVAHGLSNNTDIVFTSLTGGAGLTANTVTYWVINASADDFQVSTTRGGAAVNITTNYTAATVARVIRWVANVDATEIGFGT